jgi:hypothetical protein
MINRHLSGNPHNQNEIRSNLASGAHNPRTFLVVLFAWSALCLASQAVAALVFWLRGSPAPWAASVPYFYVFGSIADLGCLSILYLFLKKEGYHLKDLFNQPKRPAWRDVLIGAGLFLLLFPIAIMGVSILANLIVYGTIQPDIVSTLFTRGPLWANVYSLVIWWVVWLPTESSFYNGYLFPRIEALTNRS